MRRCPLANSNAHSTRNASEEGQFGSSRCTTRLQDGRLWQSSSPCRLTLPLCHTTWKIMEDWYKSLTVVILHKTLAILWKAEWYYLWLILTFMITENGTPEKIHSYSVARLVASLCPPRRHREFPTAPATARLTRLLAVWQYPT